MPVTAAITTSLSSASVPPSANNDGLQNAQPSFLSYLYDNIDASMAMSASHSSPVSSQSSSPPSSQHHSPLTNPSFGEQPLRGQSQQAGNNAIVVRQHRVVSPNSSAGPHYTTATTTTASSSSDTVPRRGPGLSPHHQTSLSSSTARASSPSSGINNIRAGSPDTSFSISRSSSPASRRPTPSSSLAANDIITSPSSSSSRSATPSLYSTHSTLTGDPDIITSVDCLPASNASNHLQGALGFGPCKISGQVVLNLATPLTLPHGTAIATLTPKTRMALMKKKMGRRTNDGVNEQRGFLAGLVNTRASRSLSASKQDEGRRRRSMDGEEVGEDDEHGGRRFEDGVVVYDGKTVALERKVDLTREGNDDHLADSVTVLDKGEHEIIFEMEDLPNDLPGTFHADRSSLSYALQVSVVLTTATASSIKRKSTTILHVISHPKEIPLPRFHPLILRPLQALHPFLSTTASLVLSNHATSDPIRFSCILAQPVVPLRGSASLLIHLSHVESGWRVWGIEAKIVQILDVPIKQHGKDSPTKGRSSPLSCTSSSSSNTTDSEDEDEDELDTVSAELHRDVTPTSFHIVSFETILGTVVDHQRTTGDYFRKSIEVPCNATPNATATSSYTSGSTHLPEHPHAWLFNTHPSTTPTSGSKNRTRIRHEIRMSWIVSPPSSSPSPTPPATSTVSVLDHPLLPAFRIPVIVHTLTPRRLIFWRISSRRITYRVKGERERGRTGAVATVWKDGVVAGGGVLGTGR
ncbi:hypothetical protein BC829DRAFT_385650 [Chytridium lagenaria]|nr:hypothetical protein BC829DRAFT_385650 [Chytridium lagenaria]